MSRLPNLSHDELSAQGQEVWQRIVASRGASALDASGGLAGPFNTFVQAPHIGGHLSDLGGVLRFATSLERRLAEIAIITVAARWQAEFEWWAHAPMAREQGVSAAAIAAIARGEEPGFGSSAERAVYAVASQLTRTGQLDQDTYDAAHRLLGDEGMVELVALCGYYTLVSYLLNAFAVPLPEGAVPSWPADRAG